MISLFRAELKKLLNVKTVLVIGVILYLCSTYTIRIGRQNGEYFYRHLEVHIDMIRSAIKFEGISIDPEENEKLAKSIVPNLSPFTSVLIWDTAFLFPAVLGLMYIGLISVERVSEMTSFYTIYCSKKQFILSKILVILFINLVVLICAVLYGLFLDKLVRADFVSFLYILKMMLFSFFVMFYYSLIALALYFLFGKVLGYILFLAILISDNLFGSFFEYGIGYNLRHFGIELFIPFMNDVNSSFLSFNIHSVHYPQSHTYLLSTIILSAYLLIVVYSIYLSLKIEDTLIS